MYTHAGYANDNQIQSTIPVIYLSPYITIHVYVNLCDTMTRYTCVTGIVTSHITGVINHTLNLTHLTGDKSGNNPLPDQVTVIYLENIINPDR